MTYKINIDIKLTIYIPFPNLKTPNLLIVLRIA